MTHDLKFSHGVNYKKNSRHTPDRRYYSRLVRRFGIHFTVLLKTVSAHVSRLRYKMEFEVLKALNRPKQSLKMDSKKAKKPLMEKMRRARINDSLNELKDLVLEALQKDASRYSKMEKADILEMTVKYLKTLHRNKQSVPKDDISLARYRAGFNECTNEVSRYLMTADNVNERLQTQLLSHLASYYTQTDATPKQADQSRRARTRLSPASMSALHAMQGRLVGATTTSHLNAIPSPPSSPFKARDSTVMSRSVVLNNGVPAILVPNDTRLHFLPFALGSPADVSSAVWRPW